MTSLRTNKIKSNFKKKQPIVLHVPYLHTNWSKVKKKFITQVNVNTGWLFDLKRLLLTFLGKKMVLWLLKNKYR